MPTKTWLKLRYTPKLESERDLLLHKSEVRSNNNLRQNTSLPSSKMQTLSQRDTPIYCANREPNACAKQMHTP